VCRSEVLAFSGVEFRPGCDGWAMGSWTREVVGAPTGIGRRLKNALAYGGQTEGTVLLEDPETLDAELLQDEEEEAKAEAERARPGLTMFTDGSRLDNRATGYAVVWKRGLTWTGVKGHMGSNQEAYDAECAALAHALEEATRRNTTPERVTIFTDAQAAIRRMASDEPGPGQQYALQARKHIATLRKARPGIVIEIRWCPAHKGIAGNEKGDEWARGCRAGWRPQAYPQIARQPGAGDLGEEVGGGAPMGRRLDLQDEVPHAKEPETR